MNIEQGYGVYEWKNRKYSLVQKFKKPEDAIADADKRNAKGGNDEIYVAYAIAEEALLQDFFLALPPLEVGCIQSSCVH